MHKQTGWLYVGDGWLRYRDADGWTDQYLSAELVRGSDWPPPAPATRSQDLSPRGTDDSAGRAAPPSPCARRASAGCWEPDGTSDGIAPGPDAGTAQERLGPLTVSGGRGLVVCRGVVSFLRDSLVFGRVCLAFGPAEFRLSEETPTRSLPARLGRTHTRPHTSSHHGRRHLEEARQEEHLGQGPGLGCARGCRGRRRRARHLRLLHLHHLGQRRRSPPAPS